MKNILTIVVALFVSQIIGFAILGSSIKGAVNTFVNSDYGRYTIYQHSTYRADKFMLDHKTGRIWTEYSEPGKDNYWAEMTVNCNEPDIEEN